MTGAPIPVGLGVRRGANMCWRMYYIYIRHGHEFIVQSVRFLSKVDSEFHSIEASMNESKITR